jgi:hypothetical protein
VVGLSWGLWIDRLGESWVKELESWVCWCLSRESELGSVDRQAGEGLGQGVGWLGVLVAEM